MIEDSKVVKSIQSKPGGKSGTYWTVTWQDGKSDNIFNGDWLPLLEQSQEDQIPLHFTKEKRGNFYNIKDLSLEEPTQLKEEPPQKNEIAPQEKGMWWKEAGECFRSGLFKRDDNASGSYLWRAYIKQMLTSLEITIPKQEVEKKSRLVEEIKKLDAEETKKGG